MVTDRIVESGAGDVRALQQLAQRMWTPQSTFHIGDLAWERHHLPDRGDISLTLLLREGTTTLGFGHLVEDGEFQLLTDPARPDLTREVIRWAVDAVGSVTLSASVSEAEEHVLTALQEAGFVEDEKAPFFLHMTRSLEMLPPASERASVRFRPSSGPRDLERLLEGHRAAWDGTGMTLSSLTAVTEAWPYEPGFHWMAEDDTGRVLSEALLWWDEENRVGEFEPVGTHRDFRRQGLASAVMIHALHALAARGGQSAVVYARGDDAYPVPRQVYGGLGFRVAARTRTLVRPPA